MFWVSPEFALILILWSTNHEFYGNVYSEFHVDLHWFWFFGVHIMIFMKMFILISTRICSDSDSSGYLWFLWKCYEIHLNLHWFWFFGVDMIFVKLFWVSLELALILILWSTYDFYENVFLSSTWICTDSDSLECLWFLWKCSEFTWICIDSDSLEYILGFLWKCAFWVPLGFAPILILRSTYDFYENVLSSTWISIDSDSLE